MSVLDHSRATPLLRIRNISTEALEKKGIFHMRFYQRLGANSISRVYLGFLYLAIFPDLPHVASSTKRIFAMQTLLYHESRTTRPGGNCHS